VISNNLLSQVPLQYINPHELQLNSDFEQNAMLVDKTDSTLWFSSSDMVYNINLNNWMQQPVYTTLPTIEAFAGKDSFYLQENNSFDLLPVNNSVDFSVIYQNKDNMPRYLQLALIANGDSVKWTDVSTANTFSVQNLKSGNYTFLVRVFQHDGIYTEHKFFFSIKKFLWQHWWFWAIISSAIIGVFVFFINLKRKHQIANEKAKTKEAELLSYKSEQEKKKLLPFNWLL